MRYEDKVVVITGGTKGIGEGCVEAFAEAGAHVVFCGLEEPLGAEVVRRVGADASGSVRFLSCDVTRHDQLRDLVTTAVRLHGGIDCLVNNAGWHPPDGTIDDFSVESFRSLLELNVVSAFVACQAALPSLRQRTGCIVNIASLVGTLGQLHASTYVATKGALVALTKALAIDEAAHGVRVNAISPGNIYTPLWQEAIDAAPDPAARRAGGEAAQLLGRMGTPREAARLCLFLAAEATFTTGVDHILSGGAELGYGVKRRP